MLARLGGAAAPCADGACAVRRVAAAPGGWGSEEMPDGLGAAERWPAGAARLLGSFGSALEAPPPGTHAVEPSPIAIGRGALAWAGGVGAASSDGPFLLLALAPMPHLGVSHTVYPPPPLPTPASYPHTTPPSPPQVWGHIVEEDLQRLGQFAREFEAGQLGRRAAHLPFTLEWLHATPAVPVGAAP
jgi:hypothetical protein